MLLTLTLALTLSLPYRCNARPERRGVYVENLAAATPVSKRKMNCTLMVDDTKSEILKHEDDEVYRRLQQGFEAFRPAFQCNYRFIPTVPFSHGNMPAET
jgi:hypothetical protein